MDFEELMTLGIDVMSAGENKKKQEKILISNPKIKKHIVKCSSKLYEWIISKYFITKFVTVE